MKNSLFLLAVFADNRHALHGLTSEWRYYNVNPATLFASCDL